jgi:hypothetical protein
MKSLIEILEDTDLMLKRGKVYVLQADSPKYKRGLIVRLLPDGGYDVKYWYNSPQNIYPVEVFIDGDSITKSGKVIKLGFHPELKESNKRIPRKKGQHRGSSSHSDLYTDENPKGTIKGLKFATVKDAKQSVNKIKSSGKSHAHKIQAAVAMEQRAREMGKKSAAGVYRSYINKMKKKTKAKNEIYFDRFGNKCKNPTTLDGRCIDKYNPSTTIREPMSEDVSEYIKKLSEKFKVFLQKLKQEGRETKQAYQLLLKGMGGTPLTKQQKTQIGEQLKDLLKLVGFTAASVLPGGTIYFLLTKVTSFKKHLVPSAFMDEVFVEDMSMSDLRQVDSYADSKMGVDVVLTDKHFFDRLNDPRNDKDISQAELIGFFKRLSKNKNRFLEFLEKYKQIVATDNRTDINIPFMKRANKVIAKTVMRKSGFKTQNLKFNI